MICDGCLVMLACNPGPGAVAIPRLDGVAELHKGFQVICRWADRCLGQLLRRVVSREVVVEGGKRSVRKKLAL